MSLSPEALAFYTARGRGLDTNINDEFARRLLEAVTAAETATGSRARFTDLYRDPRRQAQYRANYTRQPVEWQGVVYQPNGPGGLAAPPGQSRHGMGQAADIPQGPVLDWLHNNAGQYGLEFLKGKAFSADPVHIQLAGGGGGQDFLRGGGGNTRLAGSGGADPIAGDTPGLTGGIVDVNSVDGDGVLTGGMGGNIGWGDGVDQGAPIQLGQVDVIGAKPAGQGAGTKTGGLGDLIMGLGAGAAAGAAAAPGAPLELGGTPSAAGAQLGQSASAAPAQQRAFAPSAGEASTAAKPLTSDIFGNLTAQIAGRQSGPFTRAAGVSTAGRQPKIRR